LNKAQLRKKYLEDRKQLSLQEFEEKNELLRSRLFQELDAHQGMAHIFLPIKDKKELDTWPILHWLWGKGWNTCASITHFDDNRLSHAQIDANSTFDENKWGVPEPINALPVLPTQIDLVLVPLLCFDLKGHRIGYGKGYYDRFLSECRQEAVKIGLCIADPVEEITDPSPQDITLDMCVTPQQVYRFDQKNGRI
jgi:5-formyltetrahydrofolate cyclo-ligase